MKWTRRWEKLGPLRRNVVSGGHGATICCCEYGLKDVYLYWILLLCTTISSSFIVACLAMQLDH